MALRGRNTVVALKGPGNALIAGSLEGNDITSFSWNTNVEVKKDNYLGNQTVTHEEVYQDGSAKITLNHRSSAVTAFILQLAQRARQEISFDARITAKFDFPGANNVVETKTYIFNKCTFAGAGLNSGGREENVDTTFDVSFERAVPQA